MYCGHARLFVCLRASSDGVLATKSERKMLASTCLYSLYAWLRVCGGQFIVYRDDPVHRVCMMSDDGHHIVHSHGGQPVSDTGQ